LPKFRHRRVFHLEPPMKLHRNSKLRHDGA
jgi:hypothetical protein